jgi:hypothetical protein
MNMPTGAEMMAHPAMAHVVERCGARTYEIERCIEAWDALIAGPDVEGMKLLADAGFGLCVVPPDRGDGPVRFVATKKMFIGARTWQNLALLTVEGDVSNGRVGLWEMVTRRNDPRSFIDTCRVAAWFES